MASPLLRPILWPPISRSICSTSARLDPTHFVLIAWTLIAAFAISQLTRAYQRRTSVKSFPFMKLPPELRAHVYRHLLEQPGAETPSRSSSQSRPHRRRCKRPNEKEHHGLILLTLDMFSSSRRTQGLTSFCKAWRSRQPQRSPRGALYTHLTHLCLVSRAFKNEFIATYLRHATIPLVLDAFSDRSPNPFHVPESWLQLITYSTLKILASPGLAGAPDPRDARLVNWALKDCVLASMRSMTGLRKMTLFVEACGDSLWNPLWLWFFTSQAFKESDVTAFDGIEFGMMGFDLRKSRPNRLARRRRGDGPKLSFNGEEAGEAQWEWRCDEGHFVCVDEGPALRIRAFCHHLYMACETCRDLEEAEASALQAAATEGATLNVPNAEVDSTVVFEGVTINLGNGS